MNRLQILPLVTRFLWIVVFFSFSGFGQDKEINQVQQFQTKYIPTVPTHWEFEKHLNYPVNKFTGVPQISIPLYTIVQGELNLPISLSYHASGIKVDQKATWVGLGWNLSFGGAVTRNARGNADESINGYMNLPFRKSDDFDQNSQIDYLYKLKVQQKINDSEPDIFNFQFLHYSGKFIYDKQENAFVSFPHDFKINFELNQSLNSIDKFTITSPEGIVAEFGIPASTFISISASALGSSNNMLIPNVYYLTKITAANGIDQIDFEYEILNERFSEKRNSQAHVIKITPYFHDSNGTISFDPINTNGNYLIEEHNYGDENIQYRDTKKIKRIVFKNGIIEFKSSNNQRIDDPDNTSSRLDSIVIKNYLGDPEKSFRFLYDYFDSDISFTSVEREEYFKRLKLDKVVEIGDSGNEKPPYIFNYNESFIDKLPPRFSYSQDHWGYFNGYINSSLVPPKTVIIPLAEVSVLLGNANREVNPEKSNIGILEKIIYPSGGSTFFSFENNKALVRNTASNSFEEKNVGGLRISNISFFDEENNLIKNEKYDYKRPNDTGSSGVLFNPIYPTTDSYFHSTVTKGQYNNDLDSHLYEYPNFKMSSFSSSGFNDAGVGYFFVSVTEGGSEGGNGYKTYKYDIDQDELFTSFPDESSFVIDRSWNRGQLLSEKHFDQSNNLVYSRVNEYDTELVEGSILGYRTAPRFLVTQFGDCSQEGEIGVHLCQLMQNRLDLHYYDDPIYWKKLIKETVFSNSVTSTQSYTYDLQKRHTAPWSLVTNTSGQDELKREYRYSFHENESSLIDKNMINILLSEKLTQEEVFIKENKIEYNSSGQPITWSDIFKENTITTPLRIEGYTSHGKPNSVSINDEFNVTTLWGYNGQYPIARIENATYSEVASALSVSGEINESHLAAINGLRSSHENWRITTYEHIPLVGVKSITQPNGITTHYEYDAFNRLKAIKDLDLQLLEEYAYHYVNE